MGIPRMIKPFICFFILFLSIIINYQGSSKTYLAQTSDGNDDGMNKFNENKDYSRVACGREWRRDYYGNDIKQVRSVRSSRQCACSCQRTARCNYFTYNTRNMVCYLKHSKTRYTTPHRDAISGHKNCCNSG